MYLRTFFSALVISLFASPAFAIKGSEVVYRCKDTCQFVGYGDAGLDRALTTITVSASRLDFQYTRQQLNSLSNTLNATSAIRIYSDGTATASYATTYSGIRIGRSLQRTQLLEFIDGQLSQIWSLSLPSKSGATYYEP